LEFYRPGTKTWSGNHWPTRSDMFVISGKVNNKNVVRVGDREMMVNDNR
jgi:hypothetical protein